MRLRSIGFILAALVSVSTMLAIAENGTAWGKEKNRVIVATGKERQRRIGSYYYLRNHPGGDYAVVIRAFGAPTSQHADANICVLRWKSLGLEIDLEVGSSSPCTPDSLKKDWWYGSTVTSPVWKIDHGLRVGDSEQRLRTLYPDARQIPGKKQLWGFAVQKKWGLDFYLLEAKMRSGRIASLFLSPDFLG